MECKFKINLSCDTFKSCGDVGVNMDDLLVTEFSAITTIQTFEKTLMEELIDVKTRKTIQSYPTLKALYERYKTSFQGSPQSSAFDYLSMNKFASLVGDYWIDLIEQVIPSTAIWGATQTIRNTIFDIQKYNYKQSTLMYCDNTDNITYPSPTSGETSDVGVEIYTIVKPSGLSECIEPSPEVTKCSNVYIKQVDMGSEFVGTVKIIGDDTENNGDSDIIIINECDLIINSIDVTSNKDGGIETLSYTPNYQGGTNPYTYKWEIIEQTNEYLNYIIVDNIDNNENLTVQGYLSNQSAGILKVKLIITDSNGCEYELIHTINNNFYNRS